LAIKPIVDGVDLCKTNPIPPLVDSEQWQRQSHICSDR
jgi:hypothetical protein